MKKIKQLRRLIHINFVLARHGLDEIVLATHLFRPLRFLIYVNPWNWFRDKSKTRAQRLRLALEELGPIFVKFGQMLSTRKDILPNDIADELVKLQDAVPPFPNEQAMAIMERAYGDKVENLFAQIDTIPLASASIAQVYAAKLQDGKDVVVKVVRPGIRKRILQDISLLYLLAVFVERYWTEGKRLHPREVVAEFEKTILGELDLMREAANASQLRRNFLGTKELYVPEIQWPYCRHNVMVMERIYGIPIANVEQLKQAGIDLKLLSERGVNIFFTQVFRDCFFHADMHPGNIFVKADADNPQYLAVDFGIMGSLNPTDQKYLAENFLAFFDRDYRKVAQLHIESGWVPANTRVDEFEMAIRTVCEPIFEKPLKEISFGQLLLRLFQIGRQFNMEVQPQLVLLQKTFLNVEGLGRQLYPDLDLWETAKPFFEDFLSQQVGVKAALKNFKQNLPALAQTLPELPSMLYEFLQAQKKAAQTATPVVIEKKIGKKYWWYGLGSALLASGALLLVNFDMSRFQLTPHWAWGFALVGLLAFAWGRIKGD